MVLSLPRLVEVDRDETDPAANGTFHVFSCRKLVGLLSAVGAFHTVSSSSLTSVIILTSGKASSLLNCCGGRASNEEELSCFLWQYSA